MLASTAAPAAAEAVRWMKCLRELALLPLLPSPSRRSPIVHPPAGEDPRTEMAQIDSPLAWNRHPADVEAMRLLPAALLLLALGAPGPGAELWLSLFDGRTTSWAGTSRHGPGDEGKVFWQVRDGAITCDSLGRPGHDYVWLVSDGEYGDFELRLLVRGFRIARQLRHPVPEPLRPHSRLAGRAAGGRPPSAPWRTGLIYDETREAKRWIFPSLPDWQIEPGQGPREWRWRQAGEGDGWNEIPHHRPEDEGHHRRQRDHDREFDGAGILDDDAHRRHDVGRRGHFALQLHKDDELLIQFRDIRVRALD